MPFTTGGGNIAKEAYDKANSATQSAEAAISTANDAKSTADSVQSQFNQVVAEAGSNNPEVVQARGGEAVLNDRLNKYDAEFNVLNTAPRTKTWTATQGQLIYKFDTDSYTLGQLTVYVGGVPQIPGITVREDSTTQFTLLVDASEITAGLNVIAVYK